MSSETAAKRLQLLLEVVPDAKRAAVLLIERGLPDDSTYNARLLDELRAAANQLGVVLLSATARSAADLPSTFETIHQQSADAILIPITPFSIDHRKQITELAAQHRLPSIYEDKRFTAIGGLVSYGPSITDMYRRAATYVDRILKGASPADLPVEQPTRFELSVNLKTAGVLALAIPPTLLARADEVIE
jgi:putative ABC transport system substrate-binding protein